MSSPTSNCFGHEWRVVLYPGGHRKAKESNITLLLTKCSDNEISINFELVIKNNRGGDVAKGTSGLQKFEQRRRSLGSADFSPRAKIMDGNVLKNGSLIVEVHMKREHCLHFIPKNPFIQNMLQLFSDEITADIFFKVKSRPLADTIESSSIISSC